METVEIQGKTNPRSIRCLSKSAGSENPLLATPLLGTT
jgi:hypothetical protein